MTFDTRRAVLYGQFIEAAYSMYDEKSLTPPPSSNFPAGFTLSAWVQMDDFFIFGSEGPSFYGFVAHSNADPKQAVLAIRGTVGGLEWYDDISSSSMEAFIVPNCGRRHCLGVAAD
jgi:triacylglycerol lipase